MRRAGALLSSCRGLRGYAALIARPTTHYEEAVGRRGNPVEWQEIFDGK